VPRTMAVAFGISCAEEFAEDARLLRTGAPAIRVAMLGDAALSYGVGVRDTAEYLASARAMGLPVVRRTTGGTGVLHAPGDLAWSVVLPRTHPAAGRDFVRSYGRLGEGAVRFLRDRGIAAEWVPAPGLAADLCFLSARGEVLSVGPRVLGGAAQHVTRDALLHQGVVPLHVDRRRLQAVFAVPLALLTDRLVGLRELGVRERPEVLAQELLESLAGATGVAP
jgi:lipoate-protein ligase A